MTWDEYYIGMAEYVSRKSKDPSTKVGAVIVRPDNTVCSTGYNGFPRGIEDTGKRLNDRDVKMALVIHAEMNAILTAPEPVKGYTLYMWPYMPCGECAKHVVQAGIKRVGYSAMSIEDYRDMALRHDRWNCSLTCKIFNEAGVDYKSFS
jgi:dCMP deaminase